MKKLMMKWKVGELRDVLLKNYSFLSVTIELHVVSFS